MATEPPIMQGKLTVSAEDPRIWLTLMTMFEDVTSRLYRLLFNTSHSSEYLREVVYQKTARCYEQLGDIVAGSGGARRGRAAATGYVACTARSSWR